MRSYRDTYARPEVRFTDPRFAGRAPLGARSGHYGNFSIEYGEGRAGPRLVIEPVYRGGHRLIVVTERMNEYGTCTVRRTHAPMEEAQ